MGKKKRGHPDVEEILARPWCYYCERDFEDLKLLISHQKAKHFKCDRCGRRLNTAGGLSVHMNQVHKESLSHVENALPNRQGLDVEIFGMEGIPEDVVQQHNQRIIQNFYQAQADRYAATGNPPPGQGGKNPPKKLKIENPDDIKKRLAEHRARVAAQKAAGGAPTHTPPVGAPDGQSPAQSASPGTFVRWPVSRSIIAVATLLTSPLTEFPIPSSWKSISRLPSSRRSRLLSSPAIPPGRLQLPSFQPPLAAGIQSSRA